MHVNAYARIMIVPCRQPLDTAAAAQLDDCTSSMQNHLGPKGEENPMAVTDTIALQEQVTQAIAEEYAKAVHGIPLAQHFAQRLATAALAVADPAIRAQERERLAPLTDQQDGSMVVE